MAVAGQEWPHTKQPGQSAASLRPAAELKQLASNLEAPMAVG